MTTLTLPVDLNALPGCRWLANGQSVIGGEVLELADRLDRLFRAWAAPWKTEEHRFPPLIDAGALARVGYFHSFPHLATFPATVAPEGLSAFANDPGPAPDGALRIPAIAPVRDVLTPAACYHCYLFLEGEHLAAPVHLTTRATCFRREADYAPLRRQWSFTMREFVCLGDLLEVEAFLRGWRDRLEAFAEAMSLPVSFEQATDPFFDPGRNPRHLAQKLDPVKTEMVLDGLALGSLNRHRDVFGEAFEIRRHGAPAFSACVAFGLERWIHTVLQSAGLEGASEWLAQAESA